MTGWAFLVCLRSLHPHYLPYLLSTLYPAHAPHALCWDKNRLMSLLSSSGNNLPYHILSSLKQPLSLTMGFSSFFLFKSIAHAFLHVRAFCCLHFCAFYAFVLGKSNLCVCGMSVLCVVSGAVGRNTQHFYAIYTAYMSMPYILLLLNLLLTYMLLYWFMGGTCLPALAMLPMPATLPACPAHHSGTGRTDNH